MIRLGASEMRGPRSDPPRRGDTIIAQGKRSAALGKMQI
jgi:hypothetical protein